MKKLLISSALLLSFNSFLYALECKETLVECVGNGGERRQLFEGAKVSAWYEFPQCLPNHLSGNELAAMCNKEFPEICQGKCSADFKFLPRF